MRQNGETVDSEDEQSQETDDVAGLEDAAVNFASPELDELQQQMLAMSSAQYVQVAPGIIAPAAGIPLQTGAPVMLAPSSHAQAVALAHAQAMQQQAQLVRMSAITSLALQFACHYSD